MKLVNIVTEINQLDDELIIFIKDINDVNSDVILSHAEEKVGGPEVVNGIQYLYLLEVFIAKEVIEDYCKYSNTPPSDVEKAREVYEYAINDA